MRVDGRDWALWAAILVGWFLVLEVMALTDDVPGNTLSEQVWNFQTGVRLLVMAGLVRLTMHFSRWRI